MVGTINKPAVKVADETWIAAALLHVENPDREDFGINEIVERAARERIAGDLRPGVRVHATLHCVANLPPNPGRYRMLFSTGRSTRRLFRPGDPYDRAREGGKLTPQIDEIPPEYRHLLDWYARDYCAKRPQSDRADSILALRGLGRELWADQDPDEYVRSLRRGWE